MGADSGTTFAIKRKSEQWVKRQLLIFWERLFLSRNRGAD